jgi:hypothetical protein
MAAVTKPKRAASPPAKELTRTYTFYLSEQLVAELDAIAAEEKRSRSGQVAFVLTNFVRQHRTNREAA